MTYEIKIKGGDPLKIFSDRIFGMMKDYEVSMGEALWWDFEGFHHNTLEYYKRGGMELVEEKFHIYLEQNKIVEQGHKSFYVEIFMGRDDDIMLKKIT
jgi:hypothetical protein